MKTAYKLTSIYTQYSGLVIACYRYAVRKYTRLFVTKPYMEWHDYKALIQQKEDWSFIMHIREQNLQSRQ